MFREQSAPTVRYITEYKIYNPPFCQEDIENENQTRPLHSTFPSLMQSSTGSVFVYLRGIISVGANTLINLT